MDAIANPDSSTSKSNRGLLRFITCGSVDDGKSTLIGRLLFDSKLILDDQLAALAKDSQRYGTVGNDIDFALLVDGLDAEREQGITIDVAYRSFATCQRRFIVADTPGHEQYTRNMATGASSAQLAVILVDARKGILSQTRRHAFICSLLGVQHVVLAVNKIDLVDYSADIFNNIVSTFQNYISDFNFTSISAIPLSARFGDNVKSNSVNTPWYEGSSLLGYLESIDVESDESRKPFRFPVQWVNRPDLNFRGYAGTIASGKVRRGDVVTVAISGKTSRVGEILTYDGALDVARSGDAVTLTLVDEIDVTRGDILVAPKERPDLSEQFAAHILWMDEKPLIAGREYLLRIGTKFVSASITNIKHKVDVNTLDYLQADVLQLNDIAFCNVSTTSPVAFDPYRDNRKTGSFIIIDRFSRRTAGAGMIAFPLRRGTNIHWQPMLIGKAERAALKKQRPILLWFTGLSAAGKSTIANIVEQLLTAGGYHTMLLDGDNVRHRLNRDLGFTEPDRVENIRRAGEVAALMIESGLIVISAFISPYRADREMVRKLVAPEEFLEIFVDTPIDECIRRDPKGLYAKASAGSIKNFTGFDAPYEPPEMPEIHLNTIGFEATQLAEQIIQVLVARAIITPL